MRRNTVSEHMGNKSKTKRAFDGQAVHDNKRPVRIITFVAKFVSSEYSRRYHRAVS